MKAASGLAGHFRIFPGESPAERDGTPAGPAAASARPTRIALFGLFGCGNLGNDGSLEAMIAQLRRQMPEAELTCICHDPEFVRATFGIETIPINWSHRLATVQSRPLRRMLKASGRLVDLGYSFARMRGFDAMVIPGTGILDDFGERPWGMPLDIFRWCLAARLSGTRLAMVSIGAGPIGRPFSRRLMKAAARLAHYRSYRDAISRNFMHGIGLDVGADPIYPDIAFRLAAPAESPRPAAKTGKLQIGIGAMSYYGWYGFEEKGRAIHAAYMGRLADFALRMLDRGHDLRLVTGEESDNSAVHEVAERLRAARPDLDPARVVAEPAHSLHDVMRQIGETDVMVATRFHNVVCALKMGRPCISLGYARKNDVLMAEMGLGDFCQHVERFDVDTLVGQFDRLMDEREEHARRIRATVAGFEERLGQQETMLVRLAEGARGTRWGR